MGSKEMEATSAQRSVGLGVTVLGAEKCPVVDEDSSSMKMVEGEGKVGFKVGVSSRMVALVVVSWLFIVHVVVVGVLCCVRCTGKVKNPML